MFNGRPEPGDLGYPETPKARQNRLEDESFRRAYEPTENEGSEA